MAGAAAIVMPKLGLTMTEGLLASWRVGPGDTVATGDVLFVIETEKIATEIEAQHPGCIGEILVAEGETVPVGAALATWSDNQGAAHAAPAVAPTPPAAPPPNPSRRETGTRIVATPLARRVARQNGIALERLAGSGPQGRIKLRDVEAALATGDDGGSGAIRGPRAAGGSRRPASSIERVVARRLAQAKQTIPHFYVLAEADITGLLKMREELNAEPGARRLSITHVIMSAVGRALLRLPQMAAVWDDGDIVTLDSSDVGMAVDTPRGLMVPVLRNAGEQCLDDVAKGCAGIVAKARDGRLTAAECEGGAISVSNIGMYGASHLVSIINPGQSAILGVAATKPVFRPDAQGRPQLRQELGLVLSCDHRVIDGVRAAQFLDAVVKTLEHPLPLLRQPATEGRSL
ncbi:MAG: dihydrolipoamide acetyltransferase family protein [Bosea sp. (in: a-proteobacteria)]|uniref:dihydrolipoamide acetyltransferase family protein n=1 Tax=Bosea sp. (in: a-proteobacteria) TaxID=1871050 RepID=UPI0027347257|nr:dihydrolipoamide acetyltransferase family protein [Bosea sp. (in: a-proteobacteria)]MDP3600548.1 dihydrolipoamide acetyltransferase family protein [Bosea sp. (in: a-proteobacteria)]